MQHKDLRTYSVRELLAAGSRFTDDYDEEAAVQQYLELHPEANESAVRAELRGEIEPAKTRSRVEVRG